MQDFDSPELMDFDSEDTYNQTPSAPTNAEDRATEHPGYTYGQGNPAPVVHPVARAEEVISEENVEKAQAYKDFKDVLDLPASQLQTFLDNASPENLQQFKRAMDVKAMKDQEPGLGVSPALDWVAPVGGGVAGAAAGSRLLPGIVKKLGRRGLTAPIKRALDRMNPEELKRLLKEFELSKDMDLGDLILRADKDRYSKGIRPGDTSTNKIEQKIFADETAEMGEKALPRAQKLLQEEDTLKQTSDTLTGAIKAKDAELKAPATAAYNRAKVGASKKRNIDTSELNKEMRQYMIDELGEEAEVNSVLNILQPSGRSLTREQEAATKLIKTKQRRVDALEQKIANVDNTGNAVNQSTITSWEDEIANLENEIGTLSKETDMQDSMLSEAEIMGIIPKLGSKLRSNNFAFSNTANAERILKDVRNMYMDKAEELMGGSKRLQDLKAANTLAKKRYEYSDKAKAIENIVHNNVQNPTQELTNLFQTPEILNDIVDATGNEALGPTLANELVSQIGSAKTLQKAGAGDTLDFAGTASQIESLFSDTNKKNFLKKHLPAEKYNELIASRNVYSTIAPLMKELDEIPGMRERIMREPKLLGKAGEALKSMWDLAGYAKNRTLGKIPGFRWTSSAVKTSSDQVKRAEKVIRKQLNGQPLTEADRRAVDSFVKYVGAIGGAEAGSAAGQAMAATSSEPAPARRQSYSAKNQIKD